MSFLVSMMFFLGFCVIVTILVIIGKEINSVRERVNDLRRNTTLLDTHDYSDSLYNLTSIAMRTENSVNTLKKPVSHGEEVALIKKDVQDIKAHLVPNKNAPDELVDYVIVALEDYKEEKQ